MAVEAPDAAARSTSTALAARISGARATSASAPARSPASFVPAGSVARIRAARRARRASSATPVAGAPVGWAIVSIGSLLSGAR